MSNPFAEAIKPTERAVVTRTVSDHPHFFHHLHEQHRLEQKARNMTRQDMFNNGFITVEDLDDEELRLGMCRLPNGKFPPRAKRDEHIPRDLYDEMVIEHQRRSNENFRQALDVAIGAMVECVSDPTAEWRDRNDAAKYVIERVMGKTPDKVQVAVTKAPWEELMGDVAKITRAQHNALKAGVVDAEVVGVVEDTDATYASTSAPQEQTSAVWHTGNLHPPSGPTPNGHSGGEPRPGPNVDTGSPPIPGPIADGPHERMPSAARDADSGVAVDNGDGDGCWRPDVAHHTVEPWATPTPFDPTPAAPGHLAPAHSSATLEAQQTVDVPLSQQIRTATKAAADMAAARKARKDIIAKAKKRRIVQRTLGIDVQQRLMEGADFGPVQRKLLGAMEDAPLDTTDTPDTDQAPPTSAG
jgi:hypothetical protein